MLAPLSIMSQPVTIPVFGSTSNQQPHTSGESGEWYMDDEEQDMDFDLLAEYLLEENPGHTQTTGGVNFDFGEFVVSPEQSVDFAGDNGAAQARDIITQHAATIAAAAAPEPSIQLPKTQVVQYAPVPAPPPLMVAPQLAAQGIAVPATIPQYTPQQSAPMAPAPAIVTMQQQQRVAPVRAAPKKTGGATEAKRRRTNPPEVAPQGLINTSYMTNGATNMSPAVVAAAAAAAAMQGRGRKKTQAQIDRRRERNRILARRTRLRKKFFFESLQKEVMELQRENAALKDIVRTEVETEEGKQLLEHCDAARKLPREVLEACGENPDLEEEDFNLVTSIQQSQHSFVITDPSLQDNPIVFASDDFLTLTGYSRDDVLGRNCRFLQGPETCKEKQDLIRKGLATGEDISVTFVNYMADGTPFWNKLFIAALRDAQNNIVNFIGVIVKVASPEPGDPEFGKMIGPENVDADESEGDVDGTIKAIEGAVDATVGAAQISFSP